MIQKQTNRSFGKIFNSALPLLFWITVLAMLVGGMIMLVHNCKAYSTYQNAPTVTGVVTRSNKVSKLRAGKAQKIEYQIYADYTYDNVEYKNVYIRTYSRTPVPDIGDEITFKLLPTDHSNPYSNPLKLALCGLIMSGLSLQVIVPSLLRVVVTTQQKLRYDKQKANEA